MKMNKPLLIEQKSLVEVYWLYILSENRYNIFYRMFINVQIQLTKMPSYWKARKALAQLRGIEDPVDR